jgi:hypothetical protein
MISTIKRNLRNKNSSAGQQINPGTKIFLPIGAKHMMPGRNMPNTGCLSMKAFSGLR